MPGLGELVFLINLRIRWTECRKCMVDSVKDTLVDEAFRPLELD